jgi:hypothetical protein
LPSPAMAMKSRHSENWLTGLPVTRPNYGRFEEIHPLSSKGWGGFVFGNNVAYARKILPSYP